MKLFRASRFRAARTVLAFTLAASIPASIPAPAAIAATRAPETPPVSAPAALSPHVPGEVLVRYRAAVPGLARGATRNSVGTQASEGVSALALDSELLRLGPGLSVDQAIQRLQADPNVLYAEPNYIMTHGAVSDDPRFLDGSLWGMYGDTTTPANQYGSQAAEAWALGHTGSNNVYVAVIDEGMQFTHPELAANVWTNPFEVAGDSIDNDGNGRVDDIRGWDFHFNDNTIYDGVVDDHGTHVSGTIGAQGGNAAGVAGVNWNVTLIPVKFLGPSGGTLLNAIRAVDYVTDLKTRHGLNIVASSNSWGGGGFTQGLLDAINRGGDAGILFVAAAGNSNSNNDLVANYPSNYQCTTRFDTGTPRGWDCVVAVAAITSTGLKSSFSSYGLNNVDLGAPGSAIWSTVPTSGYASYNGTSMATPHVSGAVALCASIGAALTPSQLRNAVVSTTAPTPDLAGRTVTGGRLDIGSMITQCGADPGRWSP